MITKLFINGKIILGYGLEHFRFVQKGTNWDQIFDYKICTTQL